MLSVELRDIESIRPYDKNPRKNDGAVDAVARSIKEFGFRQPIVVDKDSVIVVGHTRWKAAKQLGITQVPVHVALELTAEQCKAYRIADNQTGSIATFDPELLPLELQELEALNFDLTLLGFDDAELMKWIAPEGNPGLTDPDDIPEPPAEATTKPGDLWVLGNHRLLCGDSGNARDVDRLVDGAVMAMANTDPPYNVAVEPRSNNAIAAGFYGGFAPKSQSRREKMHHQAADLARHPEKAKPTTTRMRAKDRPLANDFVSDEEFQRLLRSWFGNLARVLRPGGSFYIWGGYANVANYPNALKVSGLYFSQAVIWHKMHPVLGRKDFMGDHEWCFYGWREGAGHSFYGPNNIPDIWQVKKVNPNQMEHLTQKPTELARRAVEFSSKPGENVIDLFGGSGSTLIACEQMERRAYLMEMDALYCDVIVSRWEAFTSKKAERVAGASSASAPVQASAHA